MTLWLALGHTCYAVGVGAVAGKYAWMRMSKYAERGERVGRLLWPAYILAARNNSFIFLFLCPRISERRRTQECTCVYTTSLFFPQHILITLQAMRKQLDPRIPALINNGVKANHRSFFVMVGDKGRDQVRSGLQATMHFD